MIIIAICWLIAGTLIVIGGNIDDNVEAIIVGLIMTAAGVICLW